MKYNLASLTITEGHKYIYIDRYFFIVWVECLTENNIKSLIWYYGLT